MSELDLIAVEVARREEIAADRADLFVTIEGSSLVTGGQALQKSREVAQLVQALGDVGISQDRIELQGVTAQVAGGPLLKSSQATYCLRIRCRDLERLADVLGAVMSQKTITLQRVEWGYPDDEALKDAWLEDCARRAHARAARIAVGLGVRLTGIHSFTETLADQDALYRLPGMQAAPQAMLPRPRRAETRVAEETLGLDVSHLKTVELRVKVEYRVSGYLAETATAGPGPDAPAGECV